MGRGPEWSDDERGRLIDMKIRQRCRWAEIASALRRSIDACKSEFSKGKVSEMRQARCAALIVAAREISERLETAGAAAPTPESAPATRVACRPSGRAVPYHILRADAELRGRIAISGLTGGLLGDPAPGRSALD